MTGAAPGTITPNAPAARPDPEPVGHESFLRYRTPEGTEAVERLVTSAPITRRDAEALLGGEGRQFVGFLGPDEMPPPAGLPPDVLPAGGRQDVAATPHAPTPPSGLQTPVGPAATRVQGPPRTMLSVVPQVAGATAAGALSNRTLTTAGRAALKLARGAPLPPWARLAIGVGDVLAEAGGAGVGEYLQALMEHADGDTPSAPGTPAERAADAAVRTGAVGTGIRVAGVPFKWVGGQILTRAKSLFTSAEKVGTTLLPEAPRVAGAVPASRFLAQDSLTDRVLRTVEDQWHGLLRAGREALHAEVAAAPRDLAVPFTSAAGLVPSALQAARDLGATPAIVKQLKATLAPLTRGGPVPYRDAVFLEDRVNTLLGGLRTAESPQGFAGTALAQLETAISDGISSVAKGTSVGGVRAARRKLIDGQMIPFQQSVRDRLAAAQTTEAIAHLTGSPASLRQFARQATPDQLAQAQQAWWATTLEDVATHTDRTARVGQAWRRLGKAGQQALFGSRWADMDTFVQELSTTRINPLTVMQDTLTGTGIGHGVGPKIGGLVSGVLGARHFGAPQLVAWLLVKPEGLHTLRQGLGLASRAAPFARAGRTAAVQGMGAMTAPTPFYVAPSAFLPRDR